MCWSGLVWKKSYCSFLFSGGDIGVSVSSHPLSDGCTGDQSDPWRRGAMGSWRGSRVDGQSVLTGCRVNMFERSPGGWIGAAVQVGDVYGWDPWRRRGSCSSPRESRRGSVRPSRRHLLARSARPLGSCYCRRGVRAPPRPLGVVDQGAWQEDAFFDSAWARWCCTSALPLPELRSRRR
ncbi:hypothetical protein PVAP13_6NG017600 [Panicum virgatum]|uniref:Uncharacterized protein n=1 Tax=Panicum virgatum TaxID=38727 RepID=A0A8T0QTB6_PANVG|nr:hypothetical protein PVAP13_6NG017600 [Panicum virgatum]